MCCNLSNGCVNCSLCMHSRDVFSPTPWHQGGRVRREQQYMVVGFNFLPPRCFHSVMQGCSVQFINFIQFARGGDWGAVGCGRVCGDGPPQRHRPDPALQSRTEACRQARRWANHCRLSTSFPEKLPSCGLTWRLLLHVDTIAGPMCY
ncbi:uncharacterized protein LOC125531697 isoform X3 [Triticum urartu]|uniref:uncharacterized protein LOC125531697 isoform X3 n=1 Tax=Triticum urartu TaxID=4572 RepID=UPI002042BE5D|nr:uncharacterized protein LOC125531697 isoform X3 [Triticum urartu]